MCRLILNFVELSNSEQILLNYVDTTTFMCRLILNFVELTTCIKDFTQLCRYDDIYVKPDIEFC